MCYLHEPTPHSEWNYNVLKHVHIYVEVWSNVKEKHNSENNLVGSAYITHLYTFPRITQMW